MRKLLPLTALMVGLVSCGPEIDLGESDQAKTEDAERIDSRNDPSAFRLTMVRRFVDLPESGESLRKPFPSNWWPMRSGSSIPRRSATCS
jgi:hypothetical protein